MKNVKKIICVLIVSAIMATGTVVKACPASSQKAIEETYLKAQKRKLKSKRIKKYNIKEDELTGKNIDIRTCEFSHIRSVSMYQEYSDNIENGLIVNKETHDKITRKEINDEDELYDLCIDNGWNLQWYEKYKKHLNKWTSY